MFPIKPYLSLSCDKGGGILNRSAHSAGPLLTKNVFPFKARVLFWVIRLLHIEPEGGKPDLAHQNPSAILFQQLLSFSCSRLFYLEFVSFLCISKPKGGTSDECMTVGEWWLPQCAIAILLFCINVSLSKNATNKNWWFSSGHTIRTDLREICIWSSYFDWGPPVTGFSSGCGW